MPTAPERASARPLSMEGVSRHVREQLDRYDTLTKQLAAWQIWIHSLEQKIMTALEDEDADAAILTALNQLQGDLRVAKIKRDRISEALTSLDKTVGTIRGKERAAKDIARQPLELLIIEYHDLKEELEAGKPTSTGAVEMSEQRLEKVQGIQESILDQVVPLAEPDERISDVYTQETLTILKHLSIDARGISGYLAAYNSAINGYIEASKKAGNPEKVATARVAIGKAKTILLRAINQIVNDVNGELKIARQEKARTKAKSPEGNAETEERLGWVEEAIAKKASDSKKLKAYVDNVVSTEEEERTREQALARIDSPEKPIRLAKEVIKALGVPLSRVNLLELFEKRKREAGPTKGKGAGTAGSPTTYNEKIFSEELIEELLYQFGPENVEASAGDRARKRLKDRGIEVPPPAGHKKIIELLGMGLDSGDPTDNARVKFGKVLASFLEVTDKSGAGTGPWELNGTNADLEKIYAAFQSACTDPASRDEVERVLIETQERVRVDRRPIEKEILDLRAQIEKAHELEEKAEEIKVTLKDIRAFETIDLAQLAAKMKEPEEKRQAADEAKTRQKKVREKRSADRESLKKGFDDRTRTTQTRIETIDRELLAMQADGGTWKQAQTELTTAQAAFEKEHTTYQTLDSLLGKIRHGMTDEFELVNHHFTPGELDLLRLDKFPDVITLGDRSVTLDAAQLISRYKAMIDKGFLNRNKLELYPEEFRHQTSGALRTNHTAIFFKCENIERAKPIAEIALAMINFPDLPHPYNGTRPAPNRVAPVPGQPQEAKKPTSWFDRSDAAKLYRKWEDEVEEINLQNQKQKVTDDRLLREYNEQIGVAQRKIDEWNGQLRQLGRTLQRDAGPIPLRPIDFNLEGERLRREIARACVEALRPMLLDYRFPRGPAINPLDALKAARSKIEALGASPIQPYKETLLLRTNIDTELAEIERIRLILRDYLQQRIAQKHALEPHIPPLEAAAETARTQFDAIDAHKKSLEAEKAVLEASKATTTTERDAALVAFDEQTPREIEAQDPRKDIETWENYTYDYIEVQAQTRKKVKEIVLNVIKRLVDWEASRARYPEQPEVDSIAYGAMREEVLAGMKALRNFMEQRGESIEESLKRDVNALQARLVAAFKENARGDAVELRKDIYNSFPFVGDEVKRERRAATT